MKAAMIFARKTTWRSRLDLEYLDETSNRKLSAREQHDDSPKKSHARPLKQFADYASKETFGQVHAGGFLYNLILLNEDGTRTASSQLSNDERKRRISEAWFDHLRKFPTSSENPVIQHRLVFSMSRQLHDKLVAASINPDRVLQSTMKKIMGKSASDFTQLIPLVTPTGFTTTQTISMSMLRFARAPQEARMWDAAWLGLRHRATRTK